MPNKKRYQFEKETQSQLKGFMAWLQKGGYAKSTTCVKAKHAGYFLGWLKHEYLTPGGTRYSDLLVFIDHCRLEGDKNELINRKLLNIRKFYEYLQEEDPALANPAANLQIRGTVSKIPANLLAIGELEELYNSHKTGTLRNKRNKAILGLFIFQGISTEDLHGLKTHHLDLGRGKIQIPGNRRINSRVLSLQPFQILELYGYINQVRPKIIENFTKTKTIPEEQLFFSMKGNCNFVSSLLQMFKGIQKTKPEILNVQQIRASVLTNWLKTNNLRQVQYMAGHKYVSSTERYQLDNLDKLQDKLEKYHPLRGI